MRRPSTPWVFSPLSDLIQNYSLQVQITMPGLHLKYRLPTSCRTALAAFFFIAALLQPQPASAIIITEIMYNPPADLEAANGDANLEWIEIYNDEPTVVHLTGYYF